MKGKIDRFAGEKGIGMEKEYEAYREAVGRQGGVMAHGEIKEGEYEGVIGEIWGEIGREMQGGEEYGIGGIRIRYGERGKREWRKGVIKGERVIVGEYEGIGSWCKRVRYEIGKEERERIRGYEGKERLYRKGVGW